MSRSLWLPCREEDAIIAIGAEAARKIGGSAGHCGYWWDRGRSPMPTDS